LAGSLDKVEILEGLRNRCNDDEDTVIAHHKDLPTAQRIGYSCIALESQTDGVARELAITPGMS
jgi:hypothetical protein